jgi:outer membrane protein OmpA-like peptidoglycan-associated protein
MTDQAHRSDTAERQWEQNAISKQHAPDQATRRQIDAAAPAARADAGIGFARGESAVTPGQMEKWRAGLSDADRARLADPRCVVELVGHSSRAGDAAANLRLSGERAASVAGWMAANGVAARIVGGGSGERDARARGRADGSDLAVDRSVTIRILDPDRAPAARADRIAFDSGSAKPPEEALRAFYAANRERLENPKEQLEIVGYASRRGSGEANDDLSAQRATNVARWLSDHGARATLVGGGVGEADSRARGRAAGSDESSDRVVELRFAHDTPERSPRDTGAAGASPPDHRAARPDQPPAPIHRPANGTPAADAVPQRDVPAGEALRDLPQFDRERLGPEAFNTLAQVLDVHGTVVGGVTLFIESAAAEIVGLVTGALAPFFSVAAAWFTGDALARANGRMDGFINALADASQAYADPRLDRMHMIDWPLLPRPEARPERIPSDAASARAFREGEVTGAEEANRWLRSYHGTIGVRGADGQMHQVELTPQLLLRSIAHAYPRVDDAARAIAAALNDQIRARGGEPWPRMHGD